MADNSAADTLNTEALYKQVLSLTEDAVAHEGVYNPDSFRRALDAVLAMGKIIGRRITLAEQPRNPVVGEVWCDRAAADYLIEITHFHPDGVVQYQRGRYAGHHVSVGAFRNCYHPTTPPYDRLIEDWTKIVEADIR